VHTFLQQVHTYHHHVATNTWLGTNILPSVPDAVGLNHFVVELPSKEALDETMKHISQYDGANVEEKSSSPQPRSNSVFLQDTDGITIRIYGKDDSSNNNND
jgi:catechol 2,3-dioxygenase